VGPTEQFAANLKRIRKWRTYSQEFLAEQSGIHASEISRLEKGEREPRLTTITKLADGLSVSVSTLLEGVDQRS
jgi:transcriptional regulator with XRE-family HTH domain